MRAVTQRGCRPLIYSVLIYDAESSVAALSEAEEKERVAGHCAFQAPLREGQKLGAVARLMPTSTATSLRGDGTSKLVVDGPFAETKEQLLGLYLVEAESLDEVIEAAKALPAYGTIEIRPVSYFEGPDFRHGSRLVHGGS